MTRPIPFLRLARPTAVVALAVLSVGTSACMLEAPFEGPGFSLGEGLTTDAEGPFIAATTELILGDSPDAQAAFDEHMAVLSEDIKTAPGVIGSSLAFAILQEGGYRTLTVFETQEDLIAWVTSDAHTAAMAAFAEDGMADSRSAVTSWFIEADEMPPTWEDARARLAKDGREVY